MDPASLTALLAPFLPYLITAGKEFADDVATGVGAKAWPLAQQLWARLRPGIDAKPAAREAAEDVAKAPDDSLAQGALQIQLRKLLESDGGLAAELTRLWAEHDGGQLVAAIGAGSVAVGGNVTGSTIYAGGSGPAPK